MAWPHITRDHRVPSGLGFSAIGNLEAAAPPAGRYAGEVSSAVAVSEAVRAPWGQASSTRRSNQLGRPATWPAGPGGSGAARHGS